MAIRAKTGKVKKFRGDGYIFTSKHHSKVEVGVFESDYIEDEWYIEVDVGNFGISYETYGWDRKQALKKFEDVVDAVDRYILSAMNEDIYIEELEDFIIDETGLRE